MSIFLLSTDQTDWIIPKPDKDLDETEFGNGMLELNRELSATGGKEMAANKITRIYQEPASR